MNWAQRLRRVFGVEIERCAGCGGRLEDGPGSRSSRAAARGAGTADTGAADLMRSSSPDDDRLVPRNSQRVGQVHAHQFGGSQRRLPCSEQRGRFASRHSSGLPACRQKAGASGIADRVLAGFGRAGGLKVLSPVARGTIANILKENGIEPAPERDQHGRWSRFLKAHWECLAATDLLTVEVCALKGLVTHHILVFIGIASRSMHIAGVTTHPDGEWMMQIARNFTDSAAGILRGKRYLILDRDTKYHDKFRNTLVRKGIHVIRLPPTSSNLNAFAEQFMAHYHDERNHQDLENRLQRPPDVDRRASVSVSRRERIDGMLGYSHRQAARPPPTKFLDTTGTYLRSSQLFSQAYALRQVRRAQGIPSESRLAGEHEHPRHEEPAVAA